MYKRILIIGFRCTGKTTIGAELSKIINLPFFDMDKEIEREQNRSITEISDNGQDWQVFRQLELNKLQELLQKDNIIISAGGGLGVNNIQYNEKSTFGDIQKKYIMKSKDTLKVLLKSNEKTIKQHLYESYIKNYNRPDLTNISNSVVEYLDSNIKIMNERRKDYKYMSNTIINTSHFNVKNIINKIVKIYE